ncbi:hypothetical protein BC831DRAFT_266684 [Entophlyctis helioformis]|nr:hypothetical protein BC831DRAFT_266684 [Entophlyctis helioformis]
MSASSLTSVSSSTASSHRSLTSVASTATRRNSSGGRRQPNPAHQPAPSKYSGIFSSSGDHMYGSYAVASAMAATAPDNSALYGDDDDEAGGGGMANPHDSRELYITRLRQRITDMKSAQSPQGVAALAGRRDRVPKASDSAAVQSVMMSQRRASASSASAGRLAAQQRGSRVTGSLAGSLDSTGGDGYDDTDPGYDDDADRSDGMVKVRSGYLKASASDAARQGGSGPAANRVASQHKQPSRHGGYTSAPVDAGENDLGDDTGNADEDTTLSRRGRRPDPAQDLHVVGSRTQETNRPPLGSTRMYSKSIADKLAAHRSSLSRLDASTPKMILPAFGHRGYHKKMSESSGSSTPARTSSVTPTPPSQKQRSVSKHARQTRVTVVPAQDADPPPFHKYRQMQSKSQDADESQRHGSGRAALYPSTPDQELMDAETEDTGPMDACPICERKFRVERLDVHLRACEKVAKGQARRKVFDPSAMRARGTELESFSVKRKGPGSSSVAVHRATEPDDNESGKPNWRAKHEQLLSMLRQARQVSTHLAKGGKVADLPPPVAAVNTGRPCPHCSRKFAEGSWERHTQICGNLKHGPPRRAPMRGR